MEDGLFILYMLVPSLAFVLLVATCHWRSRSYELNALDTFLAGLSERRKTQEAEELFFFFPGFSFWVPFFFIDLGEKCM